MLREEAGPGAHSSLAMPEISRPPLRKRILCP